MFLVSGNIIGATLHHSQRTDTITEAQAVAIEATLAGRWSIDRHECSDGSLALLLSAPGDEMLDVVFYVEADGNGFNLSVMHGDELQARGQVDSPEALLRALHTIH